MAQKSPYQMAWEDYAQLAMPDNPEENRPELASKMQGNAMMDLAGGRGADMAKPTAIIAKQAQGRSLADFGVLSAAEADFVEKTRLGVWCKLGDKVPETGTVENTVRAGLIRFLALGGDEDAPVHEKGVQLSGAWIGEELDLDGAKMPHSLSLLSCKFKFAPVFLGASGENVVLSGSAFPGLCGDRLVLSGGLFLQDVKAFGEVRLLGAKIGGNLQCAGGSFEIDDGCALNCDSVDISGNVFLTYSCYAKGEKRFGAKRLVRFRSRGEVRLLGAKIGGVLSCKRGIFENEGGRALSCDGANLAGNVFLDDKFKAKGEVRLHGVNIGGNLSCEGGKFENHDGDELVCESLGIRGYLLLRDAQIVGGFSLAHAEVAILADDMSSWPDDKLALDGFRYVRIDSTSPTDARTRIAWLKKQHPQFLHGRDFAVQPWTHLAKVLRESGHERDAVKVEIERERLLAASERMGKGLALWLHRIYGLLADYGYRPLKPLRFALGTWLWFALLYAVAGQNGWFGPSNPLVFQNPAYAHCRPDFIEDATTRPKHGNWVTCPDLPGEYTAFSPLVYSLDMILPVIELGQAKDWGPITPSPPVLQKHGDWQDALIPMVNEPVSVFDQRAWTPGLVLRLLTWTEQLLGWIFGIVLAGALTGLFQRKGE